MESKAGRVAAQSAKVVYCATSRVRIEDVFPVHSFDLVICRPVITVLLDKEDEQ
jgi:hypothetical protein